MNVLEEIEEFFSVFHDASLEACENKGDDLILKIDCLYLAEKIQSEFRYFFVELIGWKKFELKPWWNDEVKARTSQIVTDLDEIFSYDLGIELAMIEKDVVNVYCNVDQNEALAGGDLRIIAESVLVRTQDGTIISQKELDRLAQDYWDSLV